MTTSAHQRERRRLAEALKELRIGEGLSGARLAGLIGWPQSKVSRIETRSQLPSEDDVGAWVAATNAPPGTLDALLAILRGARIEYAAWKDAFRESGADGVQAGILELEAQSTRIAEFQPSIISGLVQTSEYADELLRLPSGPLSFGADDASVDRMIAERMERQRVLYQPDRRIQVVMLEGALRTRLVSADVLAGQLDRLIAVSGLPALELGIIPFEASVPVFTLTGFRLYDDLVIVESIDGEQQLADPDDVARYEKYLELLRNAAKTGRDAVSVIQRSLEGL